MRENLVPEKERECVCVCVCGGGVSMRMVSFSADMSSTHEFGH